MTDVPATLSGAECNGDGPPENDQQPTTKRNDDDRTDVDGTSPFHRAEPSSEGSPTRGDQEESGKSQGNMRLNSSMDEKTPKENPEEHLFIVHKAITDLSLQETRADEMIFREGNRNYSFLHRNCFTVYDSLCMKCVSVLCWESNPGNSFKISKLL